MRLDIMEQIDLHKIIDAGLDLQSEGSVYFDVEKIQQTSTTTENCQEKYRRTS